MRIESPNRKTTPSALENDPRIELTPHLRRLDGLELPQDGGGARQQILVARAHIVADR
jgi:hypothetical protein